MFPWTPHKHWVTANKGKAGRLLECRDAHQGSPVAGTWTGQVNKASAAHVHLECEQRSHSHFLVAKWSVHFTEKISIQWIGAPLVCSCTGSEIHITYCCTNNMNTNTKILLNSSLMFKHVKQQRKRQHTSQFVANCKLLVAREEEVHPVYNLGK